MSAEKSKVTSLGLLRGIAVLMVCFCHFGKPVAKGLVAPAFFDCLGEYGKYGVQVFFVISGFVIPYSLLRARYQIEDYPRFLLKRIIRLHPPYLAALGITLLVSFFASKARHVQFPENELSVLKSLFYIHAPADNPVFWTLKVEAQYYLFIGLFFVVLTKYKKLSICIGMPILIVLSHLFLKQYIFFFEFIDYFFIGILGYSIYTRDGSSKFEIAALLGLIAYSATYNGVSAALAATLTVMVILYYRKPLKPWVEFTGEISYSLYLIHFPLGIKLINMMQKKTLPQFNWVLFILATIFCYFFAIAFWIVIEKRSALWSNKILYKAKRISLTT